MSLVHAWVRRARLAMVLLVLGASFCSWAQGSDPIVSNPKKGFHVDIDEDGIKTFTLIGKKPTGEAELLPTAPKALPKSLATSDLAQVQEVGLVRSRSLTEAEATALRKSWQPPQEGALSLYHQAALFGLRELTGLEATTPADWRRLLKLTPPAAGNE